MIKFTMDTEDKMIFGVILSGENIKNLIGGEPIHFHCSELEVPYLHFKEMVIVYYPTEEMALEDFRSRGWITERTKLKEDLREQ